MMNSSSANEVRATLYRGWRPRILIADDHILIAEACKNVLEPEFQVVGIVADGRRLVELETELEPDVVILDISMPELNGLDAGEQIKRRKPGTKLIYLTVACGEDVAAEALRRGASGYVLKHGELEELRVAVRRALRGESYVSSLLDRDQVSMYLRTGAKHRRAKELTARQAEILQLMAEGKRTKEIANILGVAYGTVLWHKSRTMDTLRIKTRAGLIDYAVRHHSILGESN